MGYLYLFISLITGATKGLFGKKVSQLVSGTRGAAVTNLIRMILCTLIGAVFFKEKVTLRCVIGLVLAFAAILLLK